MSSQLHLHNQIPSHLLDSLSRATAMIDEGRTLQTMVSRIRTQEQQLFPLNLNSFTMTVRRRHVHPEPELEVEEKLFMFESVFIDISKRLCDEETCAICLVEYKEQDIGNILPCNHGFHKECIEAWTRTHPTCPICRHDL